MLLTNIPRYARNSADVTTEARRVAAVAATCGSSATAPLLPYMTTANTARDMDRVREALGAEFLVRGTRHDFAC
ncbi:hypothetical protein ABTX61_10300 [Amycolatopsis japonica]|uniref:hypothetical protein n=1 Tax=Amycolatopsis japonica TaxID=208439 RepID=UPI003319AB30